MERTQLPTTRQRWLAKARNTALALLLGTSAQHGSAQTYYWYAQEGQDNFTGSMEYNNPRLQRLNINGINTASVPNGLICYWPHHRKVPINTPWGQDYGGVETYYSLPYKTTSQTVQLVLTFNHWDYTDFSGYPSTFQVFVDGVLSSTCSATQVSGSYIQGGDCIMQVNLTYLVGSGWPSGTHEFGLRHSIGGTPRWDVRFKAVMLGTQYSEILGYYNAPALPLTILRDPPGDASYSSITNASDVCSGTTSSITTGNTQDGYFKARIGVAGVIPVIGLDYEIYGEVGVDLAASQSQTSSNEYQTCVSTSSTFSTPASGAPDDVFIGSQVRYAYGTYVSTTRPTCGTVVSKNEFWSAPVGTLMSFNYTESYIRGTVIPDLTADIATMPPGNARAAAETQLSVWYQMLEMNDQIKANAPLDVTRNFNGGGNGQTYDLTSSTTEAYSIDYDAQLESGLSYEFGVNIGGSGITTGGSAHFQQGYGRGETGSNVATNTVEYHLEDGNSSDEFAVKVYRDQVLGTYVFALDSAASSTSCDYEGGYQLDQPQLWIGSMGSTNAQLNEVPIGGNAIFPIYVCNNSNVERTYKLTSDFTSNPLGAIISGYNGITSGSTVSIVVPPNGCGPVGNIYLSQPDNSIVDFDGIQLTLSSDCGDISTAVTLSAHFGTGNFGSYCQPASTAGTTLGDYVDGVVLSNINNTGTGNVAGASYTDFSGQFSTPLSRNAQRVVAITAGTGLGDHFAAWIDYDHDGTFEASEKLGEFANSAAGETQNIAFTVPVSAQLGSTIMRVRGVAFGTGEPAPVDPCYSYQAGETEDYAVVINANTPQDCAGVNNGTALPGTACNDGSATTGNDTWTANCLCVGQVIDCAGVPGGTTSIGSPCDDGNANTDGDAYDANCQCAGLLYDCLGVLGGTTVQGTTCDDGDAGTGNDVYNASCQCAGQLIDCLGVIGGTTTVGTPCNDGNPLSGGDAYAANCECVGAFATDCAGVAGGTAQPGTACDDNDGTTGNDTYGVNCTCAGEPYDCAGNPGGTQLPGTPCDDGNSASNNDTFTAECTCEGVFANDCLGVPGGTALPGAACDDGNADTGNDVYDAFCACTGQLTDCNGVIGGPAQPGFGCDDGNAATGGDVIDENCVCAGQLIDCLGLPGGEALVGSACDDANASTSNDVYTTECICAGVLPNDCEGVAGGTAQPGTTCDDGDATTGNDVYGTNCVCAGELIDCEGTIGGPVLPGTPCDDGVACTANDVRGADCVCSGTTITIGAISGATTVIGNTSNVYLVAPVANANSYNWALPNGWSTIDNGAFALIAEVGNTPGPVELCVTATVGACEVTSCVTVTVDFNTGITTSDATSADWFTVQPNPSNGMFNILPSDDGKEPVRISVHDGVGRNVIAPFMLSLERSFPLDMGNVAPGAYYLIATRGDRQQVVKLVVAQ